MMIENQRQIYDDYAYQYFAKNLLLQYLQNFQKIYPNSIESQNHRFNSQKHRITEDVLKLFFFNFL
ncbi:hypothetical protein pb186bvf_014469 [Paramecium bursaria]